MTLSEERPTGFLHLVASAPPRSKVVFLQAEIMFLKSPEGSFASLPSAHKTPRAEGYIARLRCTASWNALAF